MNLLMEGGKTRDILSRVFSIGALVLSVISILVGVFQFQTQNKSDLLANCAFDRNAKTQLEVHPLGGLRDATDFTYTFKINTKCLLLNNGRKTVSIIRARSGLTYDGRPAVSVIEPVSLYKNDLVDKAILPVILAPGESREVSLWLNVSVDTYGEPKNLREGLARCAAKKGSLKLYWEYGNCLYGEDFYLVNYVYMEDSGTFEGYNGVGFQFLTNENVLSTFEVDLMHDSMYSIANEAEKRFFDQFKEQRRDRDETNYLYRGYREKLGER